MPLKGTVWRVFPLIALIALGAFFHSTPGSAQFLWLQCLSGLVAGDSAICGRLAAVILRLRLAGCDWGVQTTTGIGAGWACNSQIAAGCGPLRFKSAAMRQKNRSRSGIASDFGADCDPNR